MPVVVGRKGGPTDTSRLSEFERLDRPHGHGVSESLVNASRVPGRRGSALVVLIGILLTSCSRTPNARLGTNGVCVGPTESFVVSSVNMEPTIAYRQSVTVDLGAFRSTNPQRGDIVLLKPPREPDIQNTNTIDRVIGLPGDRLSSVGGHVEIDGTRLSEPWLAGGTVT